MGNKIPLRESVKYPSLVGLKVSKETKDKLRLLKDMGVNTGELSRDALNGAIDQALAVLDKKSAS